MTFIATGRIKKALGVTPQFHPFFGTTLLSMLHTGVNTETPTRWGSAEENQLLRDFYSPPGAPPKKPFFIPFGRPDPSNGFWRNDKYSGGSLQSARTREDFAEALVRVSRPEWKFAAGYLDTLSRLLPVTGGHVVKLPVLDLAAWMFRAREVPNDLTEIVRLFREEFHIADAVFDSLFDGHVNESAAEYFADAPASEEDLILLTGGVPTGPLLGDQNEEAILARIDEYLATTANLVLPTGFARNFYHALKAQRFVVLAGRPGTGKTAFARAFAASLSVIFGGAVNTIIVPIGHEQSDSDTIGYAKIAGGLEPTELTRELFLSNRPRDVYIVIVDEMNLSQADYYLARLLPAIESDAPIELPGTPERVQLPADAYFVGTINSFLEESSRVPLSGPIKRRSNIIEMPNVLDAVIKDQNGQAFTDLCRTLLSQTLARYQKHSADDAVSVFDGFRISDLQAAIGANSIVLTTERLATLRAIVSACATNSLTSLTAGVLQDVLDFLAMTPDRQIDAALDRQIGQKIVPQLNGPAAAANELKTVLLAQTDAHTRFPHGLAALDSLLASLDPSSGLVYFKY